MIYAKIENGVIIHRSVKDEIIEDTENVKRVDHLNPEPGEGWTYNKNTGYSPPFDDGPIRIKKTKLLDIDLDNALDNESRDLILKAVARDLISKGKK